MSPLLLARGRVTVVAQHATHPGYISVHWERTDGYREPGMQPAPMWLPESAGLRVGDQICVTVERADAMLKAREQQ